MYSSMYSECGWFEKQQTPTYTRGSSRPSICFFHLFIFSQFYPYMYLYIQVYMYTYSRPLNSWAHSGAHI